MPASDASPSKARTSFGPVHRGQIVTQTCRNRLCVNPEHLQLVEEIPLDYGHTTG
jgi:hypothetical protein